MEKIKVFKHEIRLIHEVNDKKELLLGYAWDQTAEDLTLSEAMKVLEEILERIKSNLKKELLGKKDV
jgi:hypothetical protein